MNTWFENNIIFKSRLIIYMLGYLSGGIICSVSFEEQIMSKNKYPNMFSRQMETIVFIILQIFFATLAVLKIGEYKSNSLHLARKYIEDITRWREDMNFMFEWQEQYYMEKPIQQKQKAGIVHSQRWHTSGLVPSKTLSSI